MVSSTACLAVGFVLLWNSGFIGAEYGLPFAGPFTLLLSRLDATRVASLFYLGPPVTMIMAWAAFGDTLQSTDVIGLIIVAVGVVVVQRQ